MTHMKNTRVSRPAAKNNFQSGGVFWQNPEKSRRQSPGSLSAAGLREETETLGSISVGDVGSRPRVS